MSAIFSWEIHIRNLRTVACTVLKLCYASKSVTNGRTDGRTNAPEAICPSAFFEVGGIIKRKNEYLMIVNPYLVCKAATYGSYILIIYCINYIYKKSWTNTYNWKYCIKNNVYSLLYFAWRNNCTSFCGQYIIISLTSRLLGRNWHRLSCQYNILTEIWVCILLLTAFRNLFLHNNLIGRTNLQTFVRIQCENHLS